MPAKGQSCRTCNGHCCHSIIAYVYPDEIAKELLDKHAKGDIPKWADNPHEYSHKELLAFGMIEVALPETKDHCEHLDKEGRCDRYLERPKLCKSYWCHGKLWQART
jgi:Fe-S-cluster containining protein